MKEFLRVVGIYVLGGIIIFIFATILYESTKRDPRCDDLSWIIYRAAECEALKLYNNLDYLQGMEKLDKIYGSSKDPYKNCRVAIAHAVTLGFSLHDLELLHYKMGDRNVNAYWKDTYKTDFCKHAETMGWLDKPFLRKTKKD